MYTYSCVLIRQGWLALFSLYRAVLCFTDFIWPLMVPQPFLFFSIRICFVINNCKHHCCYCVISTDKLPLSSGDLTVNAFFVLGGTAKGSFTLPFYIYIFIVFKAGFGQVQRIDM